MRGEATRPASKLLLADPPAEWRESIRQLVRNVWKRTDPLMLSNIRAATGPASSPLT